MVGVTRDPFPLCVLFALVAFDRYRDTDETRWVAQVLLRFLHSADERFTEVTS